MRLQGREVMRAYRATTKHSYSYDHTSFNLELGNPNSLRIHLSLHFKYAMRDGGFWFGFRPEVELHRHTDRLKKLGEDMRHAKRWFNCMKCGRGAWGEPGLHHPKGWDFIHMQHYCEDCVKWYTCATLLKPPFGEPQIPEGVRTKGL